MCIRDRCAGADGLDPARRDERSRSLGDIDQQIDVAAGQIRQRLDGPLVKHLRDRHTRCHFEEATAQLGRPAGGSAAQLHAGLAGQSQHLARVVGGKSDARKQGQADLVELHHLSLIHI